MGRQQVIVCIHLFESVASQCLVICGAVQNSKMFVTCMYAVSTLLQQMTYTFDRRQNSDIEVGTGNLKLIFSGNNGKLTRYVNSRSSVWHLEPVFIFLFHLVLAVKNALNHTLVNDSLNFCSIKG